MVPPGFVGCLTGYFVETGCDLFATTSPVIILSCDELTWKVIVRVWYLQLLRETHRTRSFVPGAVGYMGTSAFVRKIYTNVKIDWLRSIAATQGILKDLPTCILKDGGHKSFFIIFSFLQRDCENLTLYNVVFPFSEWVSTPQLKEQMCGRDIKHTRFCFYQLLSNKRWGQMFKADMASVFQPSPTWDQRT